MDFIYFLLKNSSFLAGDVWEMPHSLWYEDGGGYILGMILMVFISLIVCAFYYQVFPRIFKNIAMTRFNWLLFLLMNAGIVFLTCFLVSRSGIENYATLNGYIDSNPSILSVLQKGTMDMWLYAAQNTIYSVLFFLGFSFLCRIHTRGFNIPF